MNSNRECKVLNLRSIYGNERGLALSVALMLLAVLAAMGGAAVVATRTEIKIGSNYKVGTQAFYTAEAGLQAAIRELDDYDGTDDFLTVSLPRTLYNATSFGDGTYTVSLIDKTPPPPSYRIIEATSTGTAPNGARRVVRALLEQGSKPPTMAVINNGMMEFPISGNLSIMGTCGGIHANGDLGVNGNPGAEMTDGLTSSGVMDINGTPCVGSALCDDNSPPDEFLLNTQAEQDAYTATNSGKPKVPVPVVNPALFAKEVASLGLGGKGYILNDDGTVTVGGSCDAYGLCSGGSTVSTPGGWSFQSGQWKLGSSDDTANGVFYAETSVWVQSSPGDDDGPWLATIIARDSIKWSGSPVIKSYPTNNDELKGITLVTGNDLKISGSVGIDGQGGAILVHQQLVFSGNITVDGFIVAGDGRPTWAEDPFPTAGSGTNLSSTHSMSGNPTVHYDCQQVVCNNAACGVPKVQISPGSWTEF